MVFDIFSSLFLLQVIIVGLILPILSYLLFPVLGLRLMLKVGLIEHACEVLTGPAPVCEKSGLLRI